MKVLVVDDDAVTRRVLDAMLRTIGHEPVVVESGAEAWERLIRDPLRVVIGDWLMPEIDGLELARRIRAQTDQPYCYFILLTNVESTKDNLVQATESGVDDFLTKPVCPDLLWARLRVAERILSFTQEIGQLRRMLPMCMYCKKIRDGGEYWTQLEQYFADHLATDFTHGICPHCFESEFPNVDVPQSD